MAARDEAAREPRPEGETVVDGAARFIIGRTGGLKLARATLRIGEEVHVVLAGTDDAPVLALGPFPEEDVIALWRSVGAASGLPLAIETPDGGLEQPCRQIGRVRVGPTLDRRHLKVLSGRRPRFLARRKTSRMPRRPLVYREREIATGRNA